MNTLAEALARSPELFPHSLDLGSGSVTLLRLSRADYEQASFLDERIASPAKAGRVIPFPTLAQAVDAARLPESCHFIFHIGHVGSTLVSRLLGKHPALFSLREPQILRTLAQAQGSTTVQVHLPVFLKLWSRTFNARAHALVKATSFVSDLALALLAHASSSRALIMGVAPEPYLATIFGGENSPKEARALAPFRLARLERRLGSAVRLGNPGEGEMAALGWACESSALAQVRQQSDARVQVLNFEQFLAEPERCLKDAFQHLGVSPDKSEIARIVSAREMKTYSKAPAYSYDADVRRSVLAEGRASHATEIRQGLSWLDRTAREFPQVAAALTLFD